MYYAALKASSASCYFAQFLLGWLCLASEEEEEGGGRKWRNEHLFVFPEMMKHFLRAQNSAENGALN